MKKTTTNIRGQNPQESKYSASDSAEPAGGQNLTAAQVELYWKNLLIQAMRQASPQFMVDERNRKLMRSLYQYAWKMTTCPFDVNKGILLYGDIGVGKSTLLKGLRIYENQINQLCYNYGNNALGFVFVSAPELSLRYTNAGMNAIQKYASMPNLAIDEVGREPLDAKHYGTETNVIQLILQLRYEKRCNGVTHLTTNLDPNTQFGIYGHYIVDRVKEMFNVIEIRGESRRK